jgi:hypothetical protein
MDLLQTNDPTGIGGLKKKMSFVRQDEPDSVINQLFFGKKKEFITYYSAVRYVLDGMHFN